MRAYTIKHLKDLFDTSKGQSTSSIEVDGKTVWVISKPITYSSIFLRIKYAIEVLFDKRDVITWPIEEIQSYKKGIKIEKSN